MRSQGRGQTEGAVPYRTCDHPGNVCGRMLRRHSSTGRPVVRRSRLWQGRRQNHRDNRVRLVVLCARMRDLDGDSRGGVCVEGGFILRGVDDDLRYVAFIAFVGQR